MPEVDKIPTLSEYERLALANRVNLSDGHARHTLSNRQREIVGRTLELLDLSLSRKQEEIEAEFLNHFFQCASQGINNENLSTFLTFSSSSASKMAAQYCRIRGLSVYLIEPCFDNILHLLKTEGVSVTPIRETQLYDGEYLARLLNPSTALWLIQPNNPTGFCIEQPWFKELIYLVAERKSTIVVDFCFRFYAESLREWDQYRTLEELKANFLCFEDTGKTWSLADTKVGITVCSDESAPLIYRLHDELLLNVSPLHLLLLTEFIKDTLAYGFDNTVRRPIEINRHLVHALVEKGLVLHATQWCQNVPLELLGLPHEMLSTTFWSELRRRGVDILPAHNYFWSRPQEGTSLFRIPLSRPLGEIEAAIPIIEQTLLELRTT